MADIKGQSIGYNQGVITDSQGITQVGLNNSEPVLFTGDSRQGVKDPQTDPLNNINDSCRLIDKSFGFNSAKNNGIYVVDYKFGRKPCPYIHKKFDLIARGRRISTVDQIFDTPGGVGNHEFAIAFDVATASYPGLTDTQDKFTIDKINRRYKMSIKSNIYCDNVHAVRLYVKNFTTNEYYLLDPRQSGNREDPTKPYTLGKITDNAFTLYESDEFYIDSKCQLGVILRVAGTDENTNPGKIKLEGQSPYNPPTDIGDGGTKWFIKEESDYGLFI